MVAMRQPLAPFFLFAAGALSLPLAVSACDRAPRPIPEAAASGLPSASTSTGASSVPSPSAGASSTGSDAAKSARDEGASASPQPHGTDSPAGACPEGEVWIPPTPPAGFAMGRGMQGKRDIVHQVVLTRGFCLDQNEVTAAKYAACVDRGACRPPGQADEFTTYLRHPQMPVNLVSWSEARRFCAAHGQRLPTEAEWEWAARGPGDATYPWGESPQPTCADGYADFTEKGAPKSNPGGDFGCHGGGPSDVGTHPKGDKHWPSGVIHDLAGNVWEWTEDSYEPYAAPEPGGAPVRDPLIRRETAIHAIRGGAWNRHPLSLITTYRGAAVYTYHVPGLGFRCARGAPHPTPAPRGELP
jgi:formylglycine-generating enzyme required for sulfatase activity